MPSTTPAERSPAIAAIANLRPRRYPERTSEQMCFDIARRLIKKYSLAPSDVDGVLTAPAAAAPGKETDMLIHEKVYDYLGIQPSIASTMYAGGATYSLLLHRAVNEILMGNADSVLCLGASKFPRISDAGRQMSKLVSHEEFEYPYGTSIPAIYALVARRHMYEYGTTKEDLAAVAVSSRKWARQNPNAYMYEKEELTVEDVLDSPVVADPFHRLHCSVPTEGGGGFLVTTQEAATTIVDQPAYVRGIGESHSHGYISQAPSFEEVGASRAGRAAFDMAGTTPQNVDVAEIYDAFASNPLMFAEDLGLVDPGAGGDLFASGQTSPGGEMPINTHGGLLSYGHAGHAGGCSVINEGAAQTMGNAGDRQVKGTDVTVVHTYGGMMNEHYTTILGRSPE